MRSKASEVKCLSQMLSTACPEIIRQFSAFDPRLSGVDYVAECLGYDGADCYESAKFGQNGRELMYSRAVWNEANHFRKHIDC